MASCALTVVESSIKPISIDVAVVLRMRIVTVNARHGAAQVAVAEEMILLIGK